MTKNQHYVPRFYLRNFADKNGYLWAYDTQNDCIKKVKPESICSEKYLYETKFENASEQAGKYVIPNDIEKIFSKYEYEFSRLIKKIKAICVPEQNKNVLILHTVEKEIFFSFIANLCIRNPLNMHTLKIFDLPVNVYASEEYKNINFILDETGIGRTKSIFLAAQKKALLTEEFSNSLPEQIKKALSNLNFVFFYAQEDMFLTSDIPVIIGDDLYIKDDNTTCLFLALAPKIAVLFGNYPNSKCMRNRMISIKHNIVHHFNQQLFKTTQTSFRKWIIGSSKNQIETYIGEVK